MIYDEMMEYHTPGLEDLPDSFSVRRRVGSLDIQFSMNLSRKSQ